VILVIINIASFAGVYEGRWRWLRGLEPLAERNRYVIFGNSSP
jgi:hypothetical protein